MKSMIILGFLGLLITGMVLIYDAKRDDVDDKDYVLHVVYDILMMMLFITMIVLNMYYYSMRTKTKPTIETTTIIQGNEEMETKR